MDLDLKKVDLDLKKVDLDLKVWTIYAWFSEKWGTWCAIFWKKSRPESEKCGPLRVIFCRKVDLYLRNVYLYKWFSDKKWTLTWKHGPFTHDFLKYEDLYVLFSEKRYLKPENSGPLPEKCGPLRMIFWKKWTLTWNGGPFTNEFLKYVDLYTCAIFWKKWTLT